MSKEHRDALVDAGNALADVQDILVVLELALTADHSEGLAREDRKGLLHVVSMACAQAKAGRERAFEALQ